MAAFNAKWQLVHVENLEAFHNAINTPDAHKNVLRAIAEGLKTNPGGYAEELTVDKAAGKVQRAVYILGEKKRDSGLLDLGKETEHQAVDGRLVKSRIELESDNKIVMHEKGADFEATLTLTVAGDEMTVTMTGGGVTAVTKYKKV